MSKIQALIKSSGVPEDQQVRVQDAFESVMAQAKEWAEKAMSIVVTDETDVAGMEAADGAAKALRDLRLSVDKTHKALKADALAYGKMLDAIKREITGVISEAETHAKEMADYAETQRKKREAALEAERKEELGPYVNFDFTGLELGVMPDDLYQAYLEAAKKKKADQEAAKKAAEEAAKKEQEDREKELKRLAAERKKIAKEKEEIEREKAALAAKEGDLSGTAVPAGPRADAMRKYADRVRSAEPPSFMPAKVKKALVTMYGKIADYIKSEADKL